MAEFVSYGESSAQSVILDNGTRGGAVAHGAQFRQSECVAFEHLRIPANVLPASSKGLYVNRSHFNEQQMTTQHFVTISSSKNAYLVRRRAVSWWNGLASSGSLKARCHLQKLRNISEADLPGRLSSVSCESIESSPAVFKTNSWFLSINMRTTAIWTGLPRLASL